MKVGDKVTFKVKNACPYITDMRIIHIHGGTIDVRYFDPFRKRYFEIDLNKYALRGI